MKRLLLATLMLGLAACTSGATGPAADAPGYSEQMISANRYRVSYAGAATMTDKEVTDRTLMRAAQLTIDKGFLWFEIKDQAAGVHKHTMEIMLGRGEALAGGKIHDARETLATLKSGKTS